MSIHAPNNMDNELDDADILNSEEAVHNKPTEYGLPPEVDDSPEQTDDVDALKQKNQELYEQLKKAKGFFRDKEGKWVKKEVIQPEMQLSDDLSKTELYSLVKANVPDEDVEEVKAYARSHKITATEALKREEVKAILKVRDEYRKTADASSTGSTRRGSSKISDDTLLSNASKMNLPDSDEDIQRLILARQKAKKNN